MAQEISRLLLNGHETIVRNWAEKVTSDRRVRSDEGLTYLQLIDHIPDIVEELREALAAGDRPERTMLKEGCKHGRVRWHQGFELKEVVRELTLLRMTVVEFLDAYRGAIPAKTPDQLVQSYNRIAGFMDEEIYKTVEAYLEAHRDSASAKEIGN